MRNVPLLRDTIVVEHGLDRDTMHTLKVMHLVGHTKNKGRGAQRCWKEVKP